ncbi:cation:proton antiporter [Brachybacterium sp. UNK5269]|uniref:cation:proton antiporter n=1 Tax=Brachybacterium sp. UNK5269 TaxID=3408576 RepID=UPI003BAE603A
MTIIEIISSVLIGAGVLVAAISTIGLNRFHGALQRIHAASKPQVLGLILVFSGVSLATGSWSLAAFLLVVLLAQMLTAPVASVMVGRAAFRRGFVQGGDYAIDELSPRLAQATDDDDDEDGFVDEFGDDHESLSSGSQERFPENVMTGTVDPLTERNWEEPEGGALDVDDEDVIDVDLEDETELEAGQVAERDSRH